MLANTEMVELSDGTTVTMYASPPGKIRVELLRPGDVIRAQG